MRIDSALALTLLASFALGAATVQALHAQSKPPGYAIVEIDASNPDALLKEYAPVATKAIEAAGGKFLVRGGRTVSIDGAPPKGRIVVSVYDSVEQAQAALASPAFLEARKIGDKYATFRTFVVEGLPK